MAGPPVVTIQHKLGKEEAKRRINPALGKATEIAPWVAAGNVRFAEDMVRLELTLPWLLHKFAEAVQKTIHGRVLLEKK
jgi:hypothetical protein